ncbi:MAG: hypothetical protein ACP5JT_01270 [Thermoplasmata archaeon]
MKAIVFLISFILLQGVFENSHYVTIYSNNIKIEINKKSPILNIFDGNDIFKVILKAFSNNESFIDPFNDSFNSYFYENDFYEIIMNESKENNFVKIDYRINKNLNDILINFNIRTKDKYSNVILYIFHNINNTHNNLIYYSKGSVIIKKIGNENIVENKNSTYAYENLTSQYGSISGIFVLSIFSSQVILLYPIIYFIFGIILGTFLILILIFIWKKVKY